MTADPEREPEIKLTVRMSRELRDQAHALAERCGYPLSIWIRLALTAAIRREQRQKR